MTVGPVVTQPDRFPKWERDRQPLAADPVFDLRVSTVLKGNRSFVVIHTAYPANAAPCAFVVRNYIAIDPVGHHIPVHTLDIAKEHEGVAWLDRIQRVSHCIGAAVVVEDFHDVARTDPQLTSVFHVHLDEGHRNAVTHE